VRRIEPAISIGHVPVTAGRASSISPLAVVEGPVRLGQRVVIEDHARVVCAEERGSIGILTLGDDVRIGRFASVTCADSVSLGNRVTLHDHAVVADTWGPASGPMPLNPPPGGRVVVGDDVSLGPGSVVCPGVTVGRGAVVGPAAVVVADVASGGRAGGSPAPAEPAT
jgi:acetyltransferase-like isoleucine patch superfamily enzyme